MPRSSEALSWVGHTSLVVVVIEALKLWTYFEDLLAIFGTVDAACDG